MYRRLFPVSRVNRIGPFLTAAFISMGGADEGPRKTVRRRRVAPSDAEVAELHADDISARNFEAPPALSRVDVEPVNYGGIGNFRTVFEDEDDDGVGDAATGNTKGTRKKNDGSVAETVAENSDTLECTPLGLHAALVERQVYCRECDVAELVERVVLYLRSTSNVRLMSADEEHVLFPVLMDRLTELHVEQMLDIVECHWARSTLVRYGTQFKDMVRDRIAALASRAAKRATEIKAAAEKSTENNETDDEGAEEGEVYAHEAAASRVATDIVLLNATAEMTAPTVLRCIVVMGMSAGRRKRDLQFFQALGLFFAHHINRYKDPHDLQRVLTAFARAKIIPPQGFLALLGRRFAVLNKRTPLGALPSYRAFVNLYKMGYTQMNLFRFLADCIFATIDANIKAETKWRRLAELREKGTQTSAESAETAPHRDTPQAKEKVEETPVVFESDVDPSVVVALRERERFRRLTELRPSMFTKLLLVLARLGAPHQQYLRPTIAPLLLPMLPHMPPPSRTRLLRAMRLFKTTDHELLEAMVEQLVAQGQNVLLSDLLEALRVAAVDDAPPPRNLERLLGLCGTVYTSRPVRPNEMCALAALLLRLQHKDDIPLVALEPLVKLMDCFAERLAALVRLRVASLTHVDVFSDLCRQLQQPDAAGHIAALKELRNRVGDDDEEYEAALDIDVRETFHRIIAVNDFNTHGQYRPTPGVLQVDFRQALTEVSAFDVLEATHLFGQAFPGALRPTVMRLLSRSVVAKLGAEGEEVITEEHTMVLRPPRDLLLTRADLTKFVELLQKTPLERVRASPVVWRFVAEKAKRLQLQEVLADANRRVVEALP